MTRKKKRKPSHNRISNLTNTILSILKKERTKTFNYKQIAAKLGVNDASSRNQIIKKLQELKAKQEIEEIDRGKFKAVVNTEYHIGRVDMASRGAGYIISDDFEDDVYIGARSVIMPVTIGEGAVIGAGSFVNKDCEPYGIYVGSPAKKTICI